MDYFFIAEWILRLVMGVLIILRRRSPATALAWLVVIGFVPVAGVIAYLLVGETRLGRRARAATAFRSEMPHPDARDHAMRALERLDESIRGVAALAAAMGARSSRVPRDVEIFSSHEEFVRALVADIDSARSFCHLTTFIAQPDMTGHAVIDALRRACDRGVSCRLLFDAAGSKHFFGSFLRREAERAGIEIVAALPVNPLRALVARVDLRHHRKLVVIDGDLAWVGSHNLCDDYYPGKRRYGRWIDASVRIRGEEVSLLGGVFARDWEFHAGQPLPDSERRPEPEEPHEAGAELFQVIASGPDEDEAPILDVFLQAVNVARRRVVLTTPYFVPSEDVLSALRSAALRGVRVDVVVPKRSDHFFAQAAGRSHYGYLLEEGVAIHEYAGGLLHAKTLTIDDSIGAIGSANLDVRSFFLNFELITLFYDGGFARRLRALQEEYLARSDGLTLEAWKRRGVVRIFVDNVAKLLTPIL
ncbi:MAG TPA: cardiolipin synthase [Planctomycetota bacterium]|nr:cardiolipin synthase [Planctomycetota bacterium]